MFFIVGMIVLLSVLVYALLLRTSFNQNEVPIIEPRQVSHLNLDNEVRDVVYIANQNAYYVATEDSKIHIIDATTFDQRESFVLTNRNGVSAYPNQMQVFEGSLWVTTFRNELLEYDLQTLAVENRVVVGEDPGAFYQNNLRPEIVVLNYGDGTVSLISRETFEVLQTVTVGENPTSVAYDSLTHIAYVANAGSGTVSQISLPNRSVISSVTGFTSPGDVYIDSAVGGMLVLDHSRNQLFALKLDSNTKQNVIDVVQAPSKMLVSGERLYVLSSAETYLQVVDTEESMVIGQISYATGFDAVNGMDVLKISDDRSTLIVSGNTGGDLFFVEL